MKGFAMAMSLACTLVIGTAAVGPGLAWADDDDVRLVDMIPKSRSGETNQDAEPTITVNPTEPSRMAGSAFTWDNLSGGPMVTATAPIYVSKDGGKTWVLAYIVPSMAGAGFPTGDITLSFAARSTEHHEHPPSRLYGGTLSSAQPGRPMTVLGTADPFAATLMATLDTHTGNVDQPHTIAQTSGAKQDKLYVGFNNGYGCVAPMGRSSTVDVSPDGSVSAPTFSLDVIDSRPTSCQDGFAQVPAVRPDGTVYAAFIHDWSGTPRLVVVRDDHFAAGATPFTALTDPSDSKVGRFVTGPVVLPFGLMGQNRLGASNVSIAVDPRHSDRVYVAWGDSCGVDCETIHLRRSVNRGKDWSTSDLLTVANAMNPEVAISGHCVVGVLYQSDVAGRWETHFVRSKNREGTEFDTPGILLASQDDSTPSVTYYPYIGDYASLVSVDDRFHGMFSASNYPDKHNFLRGVKFQREVDWAAHKLYADAAHTLEVAPSIDPFYFQAEARDRCDHDHDHD